MGSDGLKPVRRYKTAAFPLALLYAALIVYASLYPFADWRDQGIWPWAFLAAPLPRYWTWFDVVANVLGYVPLGFLLALAFMRSGRGHRAVLWATALVVLLSLLATGASLTGVTLTFTVAVVLPPLPSLTE